MGDLLAARAPNQVSARNLVWVQSYSASNSALLSWSSLPGDVSSPQPTYNALSTERFYDPGSAVNIYSVTAHVYLAHGMPGPFVNLDQLRWGDDIHVVSREAIFVYSARQVSHLPPDNLDVLRHEDRAWVTLITCERCDQTREAYARRVVARAVLVEVRPR